MVLTLEGIELYLATVFVYRNLTQLETRLTFTYDKASLVPPVSLTNFLLILELDCMWFQFMPLAGNFESPLDVPFHSCKKMHKKLLPINHNNIN